MAKTPIVHSASLPPRPLFLAGSTAVGKSEIALLLAEKIGGEIISADSMQVYRGLDIGTAKPSLAERARVPHHLLDILDLTAGFDAARFVEVSRAAIAGIQNRGRLPILCGGTGLYFKALLEGLGQAPPADPVLRAELGQIPLPTLLAELAAADPTTYERIDRQNPRRIVRAVEVIRLTGRPFSEQRASWVPGLSTDHHPSSLNHFFFGISRPIAELNRRIEARVDSMFHLGLVAETEQLVKRGLAENPTASQALGYRQVLEHFRGVRPLPETIELVKIRTRQFAKRQRIWFHRQLRLNWIHLEENAISDGVAALIESEFRQRK